jgi:hypothetical protein
MHPDAAWLDQISPHLLRNKTIRNYLGHFSSKEVPDAIKLTLLYGIVALSKAHPNGGRPLTIEQLKGVLAQGRMTLAMEQALPEVSELTAPFCLSTFLLLLPPS